MTHTEWLNNEYQMWSDALYQCTVDNFKSHPMVKRMLSEIEPEPWLDACRKERPIRVHEDVLITQIASIGGDTDQGRIWRMVYYALQVLKMKPESIGEIGGGVGQFYAILRALGYKGSYWIYDIPAAKKFQKLFLAEVMKDTGLNTSQSVEDYHDTIVSFHAFGEFDDATKAEYLPMIHTVKQGYIAFNPHSGASDNTDIFPKPNTITDSLTEGVKIVKWG